VGDTRVAGAPASDAPVRDAPTRDVPAGDAPAVRTAPAATTTSPARNAEGVDPLTPSDGVGAATRTPEAAADSSGTAHPSAAVTPESAAPTTTVPAAVPAPAGPAPVTATPPATAPASPAPPAAQVALHVVPLRLEADGVHRLTVHLHPADLGPVSLVAEVRDGAVHLQLAGATEAGREALRDALPDLRRELQQGGFERCSLDLGQDAPSGGNPYGREPSGRQLSRPAPTVTVPTVSIPTHESTVDDLVPTTTARRLDLRI
jgi:hypothetical protein